MRLFVRVLLVLVFGVSSIASAFTGYFGVQADLPGLFGNHGGPGVPMFGVRWGVDFEQPNSGFGARVSFGALLLAVRAGTDVYYRIPLDGTGSNVYIGAGVGFWSALLVGGGWADAHGLVGYEVPLVPGTFAFLELAPGVAIDGGYTTFGDPPGPQVIFDAYAGQPTITFSTGLVFRW